MTWNWQKPHWPHFRWDRARLEAAEKQFLAGGGVFVGTVRHLGKEGRDQLAIEAMSTEAVTTSEIEGEILDRASVQSSLRKQRGLATDERRVRPAERDIAEMMVDLYRSLAEPLSDEVLFRWHRMVMSGSRNLKEVGLPNGCGTHASCLRADCRTPSPFRRAAVRAARIIGNGANHCVVQSNCAWPR